MIKLYIKYFRATFLLLFLNHYWIISKLVYSQDRINNSNHYSYNVPSSEFINQFYEIQKIVLEINSDSIEFFIKHLQSFGMRFLLTSNRDSIAQWMKDQFERIGYWDIEFQTFLCQLKWSNQNIDTTT